MTATAATSALIMYALAFGISLLVAGLIKLISVLVRRFGGDN